MRRIPVASTDLSGNEEKYVLQALRSSWISSTGEFIQRFEKDFAEACGTRASISVSNGTVALHLALLALDVKPGDEVIVPSLTFIATANAVRYVGAEPIFVDVDPKTWCIDPNKIEERITPRTKGIIPVHLYGHPADMDAINRIADARGLWVVEDAAEAHFARYKGRPVGSLSKVATFSFYGNKILTCGEGGAVTLNDPQLEKQMRLLRGQGMDPNQRYFFPITGYNFRITNVACAILCAQLERHAQILEKRSRLFRSYREHLEGIPGVEFQPIAEWASPASWLYCITIDEGHYGRSRDQLAALLDEERIETRPFFKPLHKLPPFRAASEIRREHLPVTDDLGARGMNLPTFTSMDLADVTAVCSAIRKFRKP